MSCGTGCNVNKPLEIKDTQAFWLGFRLTKKDKTTPVAVPTNVYFQVYDIDGELVLKPEIVVTDRANGEFIVRSNDKLAVGSYRVDVLFSEAGETLPSETFPLKCIKGYSQVMP